MENVFKKIYEIAKSSLAEIDSEKRYKLSQIEMLKYFFFDQNEIDEEAATSNRYKMGYEYGIEKWIYGSSLPSENRIRKLISNINSGMMEEILQDVIFETKSGKAVPAEKYYDFITAFETKLGQELQECMGFKNVESIPLDAEIAVYLVHGIKNRIKEKLPAGRVFKEEYYIRREQPEQDVENILADNYILFLDGPRNSGKTSLILNYARKHGLPTVYCCQISTLKEMLEQVEFEEDEYLKGELWNYCWWNGLETLEDRMENRIRSLESKVLFIVDDFVGNRSGLAQLCEFGWNTESYIIIERIQISMKKMPVMKETAYIKIEALTAGELTEIFWSLQKKYHLKCEWSSSLDDILKSIQESICLNPQLMILIAENYWYIRKRESVEKAYKFLIDVRLLLLGKKADKTELKEIKSITNQQQQNILGHIRKLFRWSLGSIEKSALFMISLLSGMEIEKKFIVRWFGIDNGTLKVLEETGWCVRQEDTLKIGISRLIEYSLRKSRDLGDASRFIWYIKNLSKTITRKDIDPMDIDLMGEVILRVHNCLLEQMQETGVSLKNYMSDICMFHLVCMKYFLDYANTRSLEKLFRGGFEHKKLYKHNGCGTYVKAVELQKAYMERKHVCKIDILQDLQNLLRDTDIIRNEMSYYAAADFFGMIINKEVLDWALRYMSEVDNEKNGRVIFSSCNTIAYYLLQIGAEAEKWIRDRIEFLGQIVYYTANIQSSSIQDVIQAEKHVLGILETGAEQNIRMIEDEILFRSHFLILYAQKYFLMMRWNLPDLDRAGCLIADRMQEIYAVRNRVKELPVSVAEVFYAGGVLAGAVLQKKPRLWKEDFSHITLCSYEIQKSLEGIMQMFENCVDELEI